MCFPPPLLLLLLLIFTTTAASHHPTSLQKTTIINQQQKPRNEIEHQHTTKCKQHSSQDAYLPNNQKTISKQTNKQTNKQQQHTTSTYNNTLQITATNQTSKQLANNRGNNRMHLPPNNKCKKNINSAKNNCRPHVPQNLGKSHWGMWSTATFNRRRKIHCDKRIRKCLTTRKAAKRKQLSSGCLACILSKSNRIGRSQRWLAEGARPVLHHCWRREDSPALSPTLVHLSFLSHPDTSFSKEVPVWILSLVKGSTLTSHLRVLIPAMVLVRPKLAVLQDPVSPYPPFLGGEFQPPFLGGENSKIQKWEKRGVKVFWWV